MGYLSRPEQFANYLLDNKTTIRKTANHFGFSKSTVHYDLQNKLKNIDVALYKNVRILLNQNFMEKSRRGGISTGLKYLKKA